MIRTYSPARRSGYTLIELMVSMTLIMFILAILASAFSVGVDLFTKVKGIGDMSARLWAATTQIREDLSASHFEGDVRLSDANFKFQKPREGFFRIQQFNTPGSVSEGSRNGVYSYRATVATANVKPGNVLHFTVRKKGNSRESFFAAPVPANSPLLKPDVVFFKALPDARFQDPNNSLYTSQWAEVAYLLNPSKYGDSAYAGPETAAINNQERQPLYSLHRVVKLLVPNNVDANKAQLPGPIDTGYNAISYKPGNNPINFNTPMDVTVPNNRAINLGTDAAIAGWNAPCEVDNMLISGVISFNVRVLYAPADVTTASFGYPLSDPGGADFVDVPGVKYYESSDPNFGAVLGVQISIRIWDVKTQQTRQITIVQDL